MRCFIAIDLPEEVKKELNRVQKQIPEASKASMKLVRPESLHLTLKFLGEISDMQINKIKESLRDIKFKSFSTKLNSLGVFPSQNFIRVIWVDVKPEEKILELQKEIDSRLSEHFRKDKTFSTHITLARVRFVKDKPEFTKKLREIKVKSLEFKVKSFKLKKSTLTKEGPIYEDIISFNLS